jgi:hypothetical protein
VDAAQTPDAEPAADAPEIVAIPDAADLTPDAAPDLAPPPPPAGPAVAFVVGMKSFATDTTLSARLTQRGYQVSMISDVDFAMADTRGKAAILLSASTVLAEYKLAPATLATLAVPLIAMDENLEPQLSMTGPAINIDHAAQSNQTQVAILDNASAELTGGLRGNVTVYNTLFAVGWGVPGSGALKVASLTSTANHLAIYAYPSGANMAGGNKAPARRLFYFVRDSDTPNLVTEDALKLFDAAIDWVVK